MKKKTRNIIIGAIVAMLLIAAICVVAFSGGKHENKPTTAPETTNSDVSVSDIKIDDPEKDEQDESTEKIDETKPVDLPDDGSVLKLPDETGGSPASGGSPGTGKTPGQTAKPITEITPTDDGDSGGVSIGNGQAEPYNCGTPGHHCDGPETHAYILNLELEGCPYCGKSVCPSFYAVDEWGNTCYTPNKCPKYDIHKDPVYYCQTCGKKCGDGSHGTCVQFVTACNCPNCGKWVEAWTCHTCE